MFCTSSALRSSLWCVIGWVSLGAGIGSVGADSPLPLPQQIKFFEKRAAADNNDYLSRCILGRLYLRAAKELSDGDYYDDAEDIYREALKVNPNYAESLLGLGDCFLAQHRFADALAQAQVVYQAEPDNIVALAAIGDASLEMGMYDAAEAAFQKLLQVRSTAPVLARVARIAELKGKQQEAIDLLEKGWRQARAAGAEDVELAWYRQQVGELELQRGDLEKASQHFQQILTKVPDYKQALTSLAFILAVQRKYEESEKLYAQVFKNHKTEGLFIAIGDVHTVQGELEQANRLYKIAQEHLEHAVDVEQEAGQEESEAKLNSAEVKPAAEPAEAAEGKPATSAAVEEEHHHFEGDLEHSHSHRYPEAHQRLLSLFYSEHNRNPKLALTLARREFKVRQDIYTHDAFAWALYRNGDYEAAAQASEEALKQGTRDARLWFHAGMIQYKLGSREKALEYLTKVAEINPHFSILDSPVAAETLRTLQATPE